jgi:hypothetical protein
MTSMNVAAVLTLLIYYHGIDNKFSNLKFGA